MSRLSLRKAVRSSAVGLLVAACAAASFAHTGEGAHAPHDHAFSFLSGLWHPVGGWDHLLAMLGVGLWAAVALPARQRLAAPALFVLGMVLGAALAFAGVSLPGAGHLETLIALSVLLIGALVVGGQRLSPALGLSITVLAGLAHGTAHGLEASGASFIAYVAGFALSTALLHGVGLLSGLWMARWRAPVLRVAGLLMGVAGAVMTLVRL